MDKIFITFEGPDGSGKTTAINEVANFLSELSYEVVKTREPGGSNISENIRNIILDPKNTIDSYTEALLYSASRSQHISDTILPALNKGKIVICDRFIDSSLAYQGVARGIGIQPILELNKFATQGVLPNLTIFFDIAPEIGLKRIAQNRSDEINRLDLESIEFHKKVYNGYKNIAKRFPNRIKTIDASLTQGQVLNQVLSVIEEFLKLTSKEKEKLSKKIKTEMETPEICDKG